MSAVAKIRLAGFDVALDGDRLKVVGASRLTQAQRAFLKEHKADVLKELRQEQEQEPESADDQTRSGVVCCGDCAYSVLPPDTDPIYGWRSCGLGVACGGGFSRADRRCDQFALGEIQEPKIDPLASRIAELVAAGWSIWNAKARSESEVIAEIESKDFSLRIAAIASINPNGQ